MASKFAELYHYCQGLKPKVSRRDIRAKTLELTGAQVREITLSLDISVCRGFFVSVKAPSMGLSLVLNKEQMEMLKRLGMNIIVTAKGLDYSWQRFVYTKELMHLFDESYELTNTPQQFEKLLTEISQASVEPSKQAISEAKAFYMALACFCPESYRTTYEAQLKEGSIDHYKIGLELHIPEEFVAALFGPVYEANIKYLIK